MTHAVILAQLARHHGLVVIAILLPSARVEAPGLHQVSGVSCDVNVAPRRRDAELVDPGQRARVPHHTALRTRVPEAGLFRAETSDPTLRHTRQRGARTSPAEISA